MIDNIIAGFFSGLIIGFIISTYTKSEEYDGSPNKIISIICAISGTIIAIVAY